MRIGRIVLLVLGALLFAFGVFWAVAVVVTWSDDGDSAPGVNLAFALAVALGGAAAVYAGTRNLRR